MLVRNRFTGVCASRLRSGLVKVTRQPHSLAVGQASFTRWHAVNEGVNDIVVVARGNFHHLLFYTIHY